jgi:hypothetical protein
MTNRQRPDLIGPGDEPTASDSSSSSGGGGSTGGSSSGSGAAGARATSTAAAPEVGDGVDLAEVRGAKLRQEVVARLVVRHRQRPLGMPLLPGPLGRCVHACVPGVYQPIGFR